MAGASGLDLKELLQQDFAKSLVGQQDSFAYAVASKIRVTEASIQHEENNQGGVLSTTVVSECLVERGVFEVAWHEVLQILIVIQQICCTMRIGRMVDVWPTLLKCA